MDYYTHNQKTWNAESKRGERWSVPVNSQEVDRAKQGQWSIILTPQKPVPSSWFPMPLEEKTVLLLAGAGGQQAPIIAATGAQTHVLDASIEQLRKDTQVANENDLYIHTQMGNMTDLHMYEDGFFDLIINPCSNCFIPDVLPLWQEAYRVLKTGGRLMTGFVNPVLLALDLDVFEKQGKCQIQHPIPHRCQDNDSGHWQFGHTLTDQLAGQLKAGFKIIDLYEDGWGDEKMDHYMKMFVATLAEK